MINGVSHLEAASVESTDLRAGAAMVIAAQMAKGISEHSAACIISNVVMKDLLKS